MSDSDDKTKIPPGRNRNAPGENDATRLKPTAGKSSNEFDAAQDKTRFAHRPPAQDDKTRVSNKNPAQSVVSETNDPTRIASLRPSPQTTPDYQSAKTAPDVVPYVRQTTLHGEHILLKQRFVLEKVIGSGGMGIVYRARDLLKVEANDRDPYVAIKVLSDEFKAHPESFIALQRESRKTQRIAHPNIVSVFDFDRDGDTVFMTMEYMDGKPLDKLLHQYKTTGLPTDDAWAILDGICSALMHAHKEDIIHSDFKPGNVFVTVRGVAKVFDFGIARAVAQIEHREDTSGEDKTLFDAGNLGALTPAYASLEMLEGKTPDIRDDIYAVGCVAYELFTGGHPFNKMPADEAERKKLKPKKIGSLTKRQWRAIENALAFRRENRTSTIDEFFRQIKFKRKPAYQLAASLAILLALFVVIYFQYFKVQPEGPDKNQMRNELEYEIRVDLHKKNIMRLISEASFSVPWETELWSEYQGIKKLLTAGDTWLVSNTEIIYQLYYKKIEESLTNKRYAIAKVLIPNAYRYAADTQWLDQQKQILADALAADEAAAAAATQVTVTKQPDPVIPKNDVQAQKKKNVELFDLALKNVNQQLNCQASLIMQNIDVAVNKLRSLDAARYNTLEPQIVRSLVSCIELVGKSMSQRAEEYKIEALRIFPSNKHIAAIKIQERDACDASIAGLGARGQRTLCRDKLQQGDIGPALVVIPGNSSIKMFAISKYEISVGEVNIFCKMTKECSVNDSDTSLPATNMSVNLINSYVKWLSKKSDKKYRLPTKTEWLYAAKAKQGSLDANRNCQLSTRGIQKGDELVKAATGQQNDWGLVNYVGNAQEMVFDSGNKLVAIGGSYNDAMDECNFNTQTTHSGTADTYTGFRVLREIMERES